MYIGLGTLRVRARHLPESGPKYGQKWHKGQCTRFGVPCTEMEVKMQDCDVQLLDGTAVTGKGTPIGDGCIDVHEATLWDGTGEGEDTEEAGTRHVTIPLTSIKMVLWM